MRNEKYIINIGSLSSFSGLYTTLIPSITSLRELIKKNEVPEEIFWDFRNIGRKQIQLSVLTYFLSLASVMREYFGKSFEVYMNWDPYILSFLDEVDFICIANRFDIFKWNEYIGGYNPLKYNFNPNSTILCFDEKSSIFNFKNKQDLKIWKEKKREEFETHLFPYFDKNIFFIGEKDRDKREMTNFITNLCTVTAELIVNTLLHGQEKSFLGIQRTGKGISISISDSGCGLIKGFENFRKWSKKTKYDEGFIDVEIETYADALFNSSLVKERDIGLKSTINKIIMKLKGYVNMASGNAEIRWEKSNWDKSCKLYDYSNYHKELQSIEKILGKPSTGYLSNSEYYKGYYKIHNSYLKGISISFEIPFETNYFREV